MKHIKRSQSRLTNGKKREQLPSCVIEDIKSAVERLAFRHQVSKSWVVATLLADALGIKKQESFIVSDKRKRAS